jgi:hypothetical protein
MIFGEFEAFGVVIVTGPGDKGSEGLGFRGKRQERMPFIIGMRVVLIGTGTVMITNL